MLCWKTPCSPQALPWGADLAELTLRYGWPVAWSAADRSYLTLEPVSVVGHDRTPAFAFIPRATGDSGAGAYRWELQRERPRARYAPAYADAIGSIEHYQVARFVRGDSTVVVAAVDLADDTTFRRTGVDLALAVAPGWLAEPVVTRRDSLAADHAWIEARLAGRPIAVSIEVSAAGTRHWARARELVDPVEATDQLSVSDPLLFRAGEDLPRSLAQAAGRALGTTHLSRSQPVGVYWEIQGSEADSVAVAVAMIPERRGLLGRIAQGLSLVKGRAPVTLAWTAADSAGRVLGQAFELDLSRLGAGAYTLRLTATAPSGRARTAERSIVLDH